MNHILEAALHLHKHGISVLPVTADGTKRPAGTWKHLQQAQAPTREITNWFTDTNLGLGIVTGPVSGNLEMLELEGRAAHHVPTLKNLAHDTGIGHLFDRITTGWFELSPSGGYHWFYRVHGDPITGNTKIASAANRETIAETRGTGGYTVVAPTGGTVHPTGNPWALLAGGPTTIPTITPSEREALHNLFATINETPPTPDPTPLDDLFTAPRAVTDGTTPGDDYENRTDWADILKPAGWTLVTTHGRTRYWRRPGKDDFGFGASTGHADDRDRLYVFTTSTVFQAETPYTKFGAYALLHHGGDHSAAAAQLRKDGYGEEPKRTIPTPTQPATPARPAVTAQTDGTAALATVHNLNDHRTPATTLGRSDDGNALQLIDEHGHELRYCYERGRWLAWNGQVWEWQPAGGGIAREHAKDVARRLPDTDQAEMNHKRRALSAKGTTDMLTQAQTDPRVTVAIDQLDSHAWELNTPGGIIDLRTGHLGPSDPAKLHTQITSCTPDFDADPTMWLDFLNQTFPGGQELIGYMQRLIGYSAVGAVREHLLPFAYGGGGNGKGALLEAVAAVLGDYATTSPNGFLMTSNYAQHSTEIARLAGKRMVLCSEVNESDKFDEAKIKQLAGGDTLTARFMRQDDFTFTPTHQLWLLGNYQPAVESGGHSFWRRLRLIPFIHTVPEDKKIEDLQGILAREHGPAVLAWIAQGAALYAATGLQEPAGVKAATEDYAHSVDTVGRFIEEECTLHPGPAAAHLATNVATLRTAYEAWCHDNGETALRGRAFQSMLTRHGVLTGARAPKGTGGARKYGGITLNSYDEETDTHDGDRGGY